MYYLFNSEDKCFGTCDFKPNMQDLATRSEVAVEGESGLNISKLVLENGAITIVDPVIETTATETIT